MGRKCKTCQHPKREEIDTVLLSDTVNYGEISEKFSLGYMSVKRHFENGHIAEKLIRSEELKKIAFSEDLLGKVLQLQHEALKVLGKAENPEEGKPLLSVVLAAIGKATSLVDTQGKLAGQLKDIEVNIAINSHWLEIKQEIFAILKTYPDAYRAMLQSVEKGKLSDLEKSMIEPEPGDYEERLSPAVKEICDSIMNYEPDGLKEPKIDLRPEEIYAKDKKTKPSSQQRIQYRCIRAHSWHGKRWAVGQIWDSANPDGVEPPAGSDDWELYNPAELPDRLLPTRR